MSVNYTEDVGVLPGVPGGDNGEALQELRKGRGRVSVQVGNVLCRYSSSHVSPGRWIKAFPHTSPSFSTITHDSRVVATLFRSQVDFYT